MDNTTDNKDIQELNIEDMENVAGGTPMSIPGGKRSGRGNSENMLDLLNLVSDKTNSFLEDIGMKEKRVDNSIFDRRIKDYD